MCFTVTHFYLRNKTVFLGISWSWFSNIDILGTPKIIIMNICDVNSFLKILHFYPTLKNGGSKHDFFVLLNAPVGVHERVENLLTRIGVRVLLFCDHIFHNFRFWKKNLNIINLSRLSKFEYVKVNSKLHNVYYILFKGRKLVFRSIIFSFQLFGFCCINKKQKCWKENHTNFRCKTLICRLCKLCKF